jgi:hypothetical protein
MDTHHSTLLFFRQQKDQPMLSWLVSSQGSDVLKYYYKHCTAHRKKSQQESPPLWDSGPLGH